MSSPSTSKNRGYVYDITEDFLDLEIEHDLFMIRPEGVPVWERIREAILREVLKELNLYAQAHESIDVNWKSYLKATSLWLKNGLSDNPFFEHECDILFHGHSRRKLLEDGYWWDIYCDPIHNVLNLDSLHVESPRNFNHKQPAKTDNLQYLDFLKYTAAFNRKLGTNEASLDTITKKKITQFENGLKKVFDIEVDVKSLVKYDLNKYLSEKPLYDLFLSRVNPKVAIVVPGYGGTETFLKSCAEANITTIELQHGQISSSHLGYSYPSPRTKEYFPDYLFTWGEFWSEGVEFPVPEHRVVPIGYPYLSKRRNKHSHVESEEMVLFISQGTIGEYLSKFAVEVSEDERIDHEVVYKLHPGEYNRWQKAYPWLIDANIRIIDSSTPPLYELFARAEVQIGVGSTAIYEGLAFDLDTFIYEAPGRESLQPLIDDAVANAISTVDELIPALQTDYNSFEIERFFRSDPISNFKRELDRIS